MWLPRGPTDGLAPGGRGLRARCAQAADLGQQAEPELGAGDYRDDHDEEPEDDQHELPARAAVTAEDPALIQPVTLRVRLAAVADGAPSYRQADRRRGRQLRLEIRQAGRPGRAGRAAGALRRHRADGRADGV